MDLNSFHPERVVFMRKEILLPAVAVAGGGAGFVLRRWELATAFEADTGLPIPGAPATLALIALSVAMAAVLGPALPGQIPLLHRLRRGLSGQGKHPVRHRYGALRLPALGGGGADGALLCPGDQHRLHPPAAGRPGGGLFLLRNADGAEQLQGPGQGQVSASPC